MASASTETASRADAGSPAPGLPHADRSGALVRLSGDWTIASAADLERHLDAATADGLRTMVVDGSGLTRLDTAGAWLIEQARRRVAAGGGEVRLQGFSPAQATLIQAVEKVGRTVLPPPARPSPLLRFLTAVGKESAELVADANQILTLLGEFTAAFGSTLAWQRRMRWAAFVNHLDRTALQAVPIIALMSFLIGMILAQQGAFYFRTYGAEIFVVDLVGVLVCREIGVLLTAIMVAGRSGSAFTAEIGSMKMREEIDALTVLGVSPVDVLVVPRLLALIIALPILTLVADLSAIAGAWVVVVFYIGIPTDTFFLRLQEALTPTYLMIGIVKAPFMALIVGLMACVEGMKVKGSAESLGRHTTSSVVKAIFMVVVMDGIFAMFFAAMGI